MSDREQSHTHAGGRALLLSLLFTTAFALVELIGGWLADSLALLSDAGHMITDSSALAIGVVAAWLSRKPATSTHSFGLQRAEVLGALLNVLFMLGVIAAIIYAAVGRMADPPDVAGGVVMVIGGLGLLVNIVVAWILTRGEQTMNVRGALLHVMGDLLGSIAALAAGITIYFTGWMLIDPILSVFVSLLILVSVGRLLGEVLRVLMEGVPHGVDMDEVKRVLSEIEGVFMVHDMHIWTLSYRNYALAAHVDVETIELWEDILPKLQNILRERFNISHSTLQPEDEAIRRNCALEPGCHTNPEA